MASFLSKTGENDVAEDLEYTKSVIRKSRQAQSMNQYALRRDEEE
jgi:hypothetical protein